MYFMSLVCIGYHHYTLAVKLHLSNLAEKVGNTSINIAEIMAKLS